MEFEFIRGEKFKKLSNGGNIVYRNTHDVLNFFEECLIEQDFIFITHNSDDKVSHEMVEKMPKSLKHWFSQNVCVKNDKISSIPIGLENSEWFPEVKKTQKIILKSNSNKNIRNLLYLNHDIRTNMVERLKPYKIFQDKTFVTTVLGHNGKDFDQYVDDVYNHKFVICPEGNGTDTHRTWECLYLGSIPIEKRNINNSFYEDLPICFVDDWEEITEDFLNREYERIQKSNFNISKLDFGYWKQRIIESI